MALPAERTELTVVDHLGYTWKVVMDFCHDEVMSCIFTGQWQALAVAWKFTPSQVIKLDNRVMYLCPPPMLIFKAKLQPSAAAAEGGVTYRVLEYFWKN